MGVLIRRVSNLPTPYVVGGFCLLLLLGAAAMASILIETMFVAALFAGIMKLTSASRAISDRLDKDDLPGGWD